MENPYTENKISKNTFIREFSQAIPSNEMVWHRDEEDRYITCMNECDWKIQLDNELPKSITENTFIPKETYHRLIKGNGNLIIRIIKK
jgi:hypothetical protein